METLKHFFTRINVCAIAGALGSIVTYLFGGWTEGIQTLVVLMVIDYISGLLVAGVFNNSTKTEGGGLKSDVGFKGLVKKFVQLLIVAAMFRLDTMLGIKYLRDLCIIGFAVNELISVTENAGLMGIPLPPIVTKAIEILNAKANEGGTDE